MEEAKKPPKKAKRLARAAGGAAVGCAAVACCCPCGLISLIVLTVARVPAEVFRRIARKRRRRRPVSGLICPVQKSINSVAPAAAMAREAGTEWPEKSPATVVLEMEEKMRAEFSGTGFWRSSSQRE